MKRFRKILFVANSSTADKPTLARAVAFARTNKATLTVVSVQREIERNLPGLQEEFRRIQKDSLQDLTRAVDAKGVRVSTKAMTGSQVLEVIREVVAGKYDLLIKPAEGRGGVGRWLFGSTDWHLMRTCPCPVWIMKLSQRHKSWRILAAVDLDPRNKENDELNKSILDLATSLARKQEGELHILHAWSVPNEKLLRSGRARMSAADVNRYVKETKSEHKKSLSDLVSQYDLAGIRNKVHLLKGDPADVIAAVARKSRVELVVMGTVARTGIRGFLIGNTAEHTLSKLDCSVLTLKPKGFRTPIQPASS